MKKKVLDAAHKHLRKDTRMRAAMKKLKLDITRRSSDPFESLLRSIIYQQLSGKAASTILNRVLALYGGKYPSPEAILKTSDAKLRGCGLSTSKTNYIKDLAKRFTDGTIVPKKFSKMTDEEIREHLIVVKGVGRWTADMFLMFTLYRPDVLPTGDLGVQKGLQKLFGLKSLPDPKKMEKLAQVWVPYRTVASYYLWRIADGDTDW
jgi:DNA-3-methyladenine glycosylase II